MGPGGILTEQLGTTMLLIFNLHFADLVIDGR